MGRMPTCSKCGKPYRNYMGPLMDDFTREGPRTETVIKEDRCKGCGHVLAYKTWAGRDAPTARSLEMTCGACPSQWEGETVDGSRIFIRYRYGILTVSIDGERVLRGEIGDRLDGAMSTEKMLSLTRIQMQEAVRRPL